MMSMYEGLGASDKSDRATAAEPVVSALRDGIPSAVDCAAEYLRGWSYEYHEEIIALLTGMESALREIASFGRSHPGHGYSCATIAIRTLETLDD